MIAKAEGQRLKAKVADRPELQPWLDQQFSKETTPERVNPCVRAFGLGPQGAICKDCVHLFKHRPGKKHFYKCDLRNCTNGPGTDHRVSWPACGRFEQRKERQ